MIKEGHVGTPLDSGWRQALGGGNHTRSRGHFGIFSGLAFQRQANRDFANVPLRSVEKSQLQILIPNRARSVKFKQFDERQVFDQNRSEKSRTGLRIVKKTARNV